ncbi:MAG: hypothetical protein RLZZ350_781 [Verrucomicrobiota bacterium]
MFLVAVIATAEKGKKTFQDIIALQHKLDQKIVCMGRGAKNAHLLLNVLYKNPVINTSEVMRELGTSQVTADKLIKRFQEADILEEITGYKRNRRFQFKGYFELFMR